MVYLVGAGPGAADLVTLRGLRALHAAEVVVCDRLVPRTFLQDLGVSMEGKDVRWLAGETHAETDALMSRPALAGKVVARLKNGDPAVFARLWEETEHLSPLGIPWEVIPGPSSCLAAPLLAGLPLTRRGQGRSFAVVSARVAGGHSCPVFPRADSLVVLMGVEVIGEVAGRLLASGWEPGTPAVLVERASLPWERRAGGALAEIAGAAARAGIGAPAVLVLGEAARRAGRVRPRILFTGLDPARFRGLGDVMHWPAVELVPDAEGRCAAAGLLGELKSGGFQWVVFTEESGVRSFFDLALESGWDARILGSVRLAAMGESASARLREYGLRADAAVPDGGGRVLVVRGTHVPGGLEEDLRAAGWSVAFLSTHKVVPHHELGRPLPDHDVVYFVSPSGVRAWQAAYGPEGFRREPWCLGEATAKMIAATGGSARIVPPPVVHPRG